MSDFYRVEESTMYLRPSDFRIMTDEQLVEIIEAGLVAWQDYQAQLKREARSKRFKIAAAVMIAVGGAAMLAGGPSAAAPAVEAVGSGGAGASGLFGKLQTIAGHIAKGATVAGKVTGSDSANQLAAAANLISSPSMTAAIERGVEFQLHEEGAQIAKDDANAQAALRELIAREQAEYAAALRNMAEDEAAATGTKVVVEPPKPVTAHDILPYVLPVLIGVLLGS